MDVSSLVCSVGSGICDGLITGSEESYWLCDLETSKRSGLRSSGAVASRLLHNIHKFNLIQGSLTLLSRLSFVVVKSRLCSETKMLIFVQTKFLRRRVMHPLLAHK
jgi:hypothetical protein